MSSQIEWIASQFKAMNCSKERLKEECDKMVTDSGYLVSQLTLLNYGE